LRARHTLGVLLLASVPLVTPRIRGADEIEHFAYLRSLAFDRDLDFGDEYEHFYAEDPQGLAAFKATFLDRREPATGRFINFAPVGSALLWAPPYLLAHAGVLVARSLGSGVAADGFSRPYVMAACFGSVAYGFLGLLLLYDLLRRFRGAAEPVAVWTVAAVWWGTPALYYMTIATGFAHANSLLTVTGTLWLWMRARRHDTPAAWAGVGLAAGLAGLVREQDLFFVLAPGLDAARRALRGPRTLAGLSRPLLLVLGTAVAFAPQLWVYRLLNGRFGPSQLVARKMNWTSPHFWQVLLDPGHGLFLWTPLAALAVAGLVWSWSRERDWVTGLLGLALLAQVFVNGAVESWTQAGGFGSRRFVSATPILAWGLAALLAALRPRLGRAWLAAGLAILVWWNVSLMAQFGLRLMDRQRLEWPRVALNQVTEVPRRIGRAAYLFFTDRERLVKEGA